MAIETPHNVCASERDKLGTSLAELDISKLTIKLTDTPKPLPNVKELTFGANFSDHMAITTFHPASGWSAPEIKPRTPLMLDPASSCLQYGCTIFEGMKAYLGDDGKARLFRPELNMRRLERSMARLALPPIDGDVVLEIIKRLVQTDKRCIPLAPGCSLYIRPTVIGTRPALGLTASDHAILYVITSPSGPYFPRPVSLLAESHAVRAWPGGTGGDKFGGNYAPGFLPQRLAAAQGYDQVLWLFGENRQVTEAGAMNVFVVLRRADGHGLDVLTPPLDGTILPGVTRASCLELAADPAFHASISFDDAPSYANGVLPTTLHPIERTFTLSDLEHWCDAGMLLEFFCVGTAAVVLGICDVGFEGRVLVRAPRYPDNPNGLGPVGRALREMILAVQEGRQEYKGWGVVCA